MTGRYAFFDVDGTLVRFKTMFSFQDYYYRNAGLAPGLLGAARSARFEARRRRYERSGRPREDLNRMYYRSFRGRRPARVAAAAQQWYQRTRAGVGDFYFPFVVDALRRHQDAGDTVVFVSGSMVDILRPIADELGVTELLATRVQVRAGRYTGRIVPPQTIGAGKAEAVRRFLVAHGADPAGCWAYGDDRSDAPMLAEVGNAVLVSEDPGLRGLADEHGWRVLAPC
ncbi:HAD family phosphatase [Actinoplanes sp. N902-109]|uniref:HAD family hydrolase n=1 Tax=Actinoplanes sp. (strain N902-109) TaxID=649831 RepID=UPI00032936A3|nr:HAD-IB family hydrolase [Actinoplanes sp. N902-109]AGL20655.1 HAD-superfamily hydrolase, subfamily IB [Actinoplanes sp. N902-109]